MTISAVPTVPPSSTCHMPLVDAVVGSSSSSNFSPTGTRRRRRLPNELLAEMATFAHYDFLERSCVANLRLHALFWPILQKKDAKLCSLYFDDVRSLFVWLQNWALRSDALRKFVNLRAIVDSNWRGKRVQLMKPDLWSVNRARVTSLGLITDLRELGKIFDQLAQTLAKSQFLIFPISAEVPLLVPPNSAVAAALSAPRDWPSVFRLGPASSVRFHSQRALLMAKALAVPKTVLDAWLRKDLPSLKELVHALVQLLRDNFKHESIMCQIPKHQTSPPSAVVNPFHPVLSHSLELFLESSQLHLNSSVFSLQLRMNQLIN
ncbi:hypothetical protein niasHT_019916 [Heterodera trifolii]|uniref:Uncharacterized protein n=1 Tax=Heterodera trifolii TaxID=157864 RepID=A0ABD2L8Q1_9BILA